MNNTVQARPARRIYILPNLLTTAGLFFGFYGLMAALDGRYALGAMSIMAAGIFDGLDGRVARATGSTSAFGKEYDSLSDFMCFGVTPAVLMYQWALAPFNRTGWAAAFLYIVCGALRLARFNVQSHLPGVNEQITKRYFQGLPIPAAAGMLAAMVLFYTDLVEKLGGPQEVGSGLWRWVPLVAMYVLALLMVSNIRFHSFKDIRWHRRRPFLALVGVVIFISVLMIHPAVTLFLVACIYLASGYFSHREYQGLLAEGKETEEDDDEAQDLSV